jgi:hypothetical protein
MNDIVNAFINSEAVQTTVGAHSEFAVLVTVVACIPIRRSRLRYTHISPQLTIALEANVIASHCRYVVYHTDDTITEVNEGEHY